MKELLLDPFKEDERWLGFPASAKGKKKKKKPCQTRIRCCIPLAAAAFLPENSEQMHGVELDASRTEAPPSVLRRPLARLARMFLEKTLNARGQ